MPMSLPSSPRIIKSAAFPDRVVDLARARVDSPLIGYPQSNSANQQWTFRGSVDNFSAQTGTEAKSVAFAHTAVGIGGVLFGRNFLGAFALEQVSSESKTFRILAQSNNLLAWTLTDEREETPITLQVVNRKVSNPMQEWFLLPAL